MCIKAYSEVRLIHVRSFNLDTVNDMAYGDILSSYQINEDIIISELSCNERSNRRDNRSSD